MTHEADRKHFKVVAFDCDGVLFDSKEANVRFYNTILQRFNGTSVREDQYDYIHMHSVQESLRFLVGEEHFDGALAIARSIDFGMFNQYLRVEPSLEECLTILKRRYVLAVATNRTTSTHEVLRHFRLASFFDLVVCALDVPRPKPHGDMLHRITTTLNVTPDTVIYVGDSIVDAQCARAVGAWFVAYKNPALEASLHIESFPELLAWLGITA